MEKVLDRLDLQRKDPCGEARSEGVPCFPAATGRSGPTLSVRETLAQPDPAPHKIGPDRPPTVAEMADHRPGAGRHSVPLVSFDPGCAARAFVKRLKGRNDTYYLYRMQEAGGTRVAMYDHALEGDALAGVLEQLGRYEGECAAVAAYRRETRRFAAP